MLTIISALAGTILIVLLGLVLIGFLVILGALIFNIFDIMRDFGVLK